MCKDDFEAPKVLFSTDSHENQMMDEGDDGGHAD
jgi:hypothetical protein